MPQNWTLVIIFRIGHLFFKLFNLSIFPLLNIELVVFLDRTKTSKAKPEASYDIIQPIRNQRENVSHCS